MHGVVVFQVAPARQLPAWLQHIMPAASTKEREHCKCLQVKSKQRLSAAHQEEIVYRCSTVMLQVEQQLAF
jgi:hypothetical protein